MLSMKQAASRPRPPWPSAASGSTARSRFRSTPRSPSAARKISVQPRLQSTSAKKSPDEELQRQIVDALAALCMAGAIHHEPSMDNAIANSQRGRDEPVPVGSRSRILAQFQRQFGEHGALDFIKVAILCSSDSSRNREFTDFCIVHLSCS